jgi:hypothetical protein
MDDAGPLCLGCSDLDHLVFLPSGDAALTRRATKASSLSAVVVRWSRNRKRYERQGVLVEEPALALAEQECMSDADARMRRRERDRIRRAELDVDFQARMATEIRRIFLAAPPGVPPRSPSMPASAAAAGWADPRPVAHSTSTRSSWQSPPRRVTRTPTTTLC